MNSLTKAIALKNELDLLRPIPKEREEIIMEKFRLDWNYHSNNLEGNSLTFGETKALILFGITAQGKPLKDHFEITGHDKAIKWVLDVVKGEYPLTESFIRELHQLLLKEPYEVNAITPDGLPTKRWIQVGKYKSVPNHVLTKTGEIFRFATPEETPALMHDLIEWYRSESKQPDVNPIVLAAEFHYKFIRIHPFDDGNGRMARILMNFILIHFGYPPLIIKTDDKFNYFSALQQADAGMIEPFFEYITTNLTRSLEIMISGAKGESIEEEDDLDKEIALLKAKFKASDKSKVPIYRSKYVILNIYNGTIRKIWEEFLVYTKKFEDFYSSVSISIGKESMSYSGDNCFESFGEKIEDSTTEIKFRTIFRNIKSGTSNEFQHISLIRFILNKENTYEVEIDTEKIILKNYSEDISREEIKNIIKVLTKAHKEKIENLI
ncbi:Fic/DOC family protein [Algoriphagus alkaliphilus]|uniref:Fic/DOC family protein n=1 Tax=Algoriphagus alkaliphilus TaxID=279824 RepID=A0A1G5Z810_9BACT|nr:Fic family protein [Algoriphagus alkaliphilus]SDA90988.1 Fic/DOC family protein [Algoriphagus alkaliphilus]